MITTIICYSNSNGANEL